MFAASVPVIRVPAPAEPIKARKNRLLYSHPLVDLNYAWEVIKDPSGDFLGRCFQARDLETSARMMTWPEGVVFRHNKTGEVRAYSDGEILKMGNAPKPIYKLFFNDKLIFTSTQKRVPKAVLRRCWPEIADDKESLDALSTCPVQTEGKRLEWKQEEV
jgi:hypothetical protein